MTAEKRSFEGGCKTALVIGVNGQDGSYLAQHLRSRNWTVVGIGRQTSPRREVANYLSTYCPIDITDTISFQRYMAESRPDVIFHTAAIHGQAGFKYEDVWLAAHQVNSISLHATLEYARLENTNAQVIYFSSAKVFGDLSGKIITEKSHKSPRCIYSITKNAATSMASYYRENHGINASVIWLFNHESERRSQEYFAIKIVTALKNSLANKRYSTRVGSLDFWCDWGSASEYMGLLVDSCTFLRGEDFILATGKTVWARDVVAELFSRHGISLEDHIETDLSGIKKHTEFWTASNEKFKNATGLLPTISGVEVFEDMFAKM
jgi:GDPmannose 4,6-dehydratase